MTTDIGAVEAAAPPADAATYDLTSKISPYLDLHMMFPLLEYIDALISSGSISYNSLDVAQARLELLKPTHMVDYAMDIYREVHGEDADIPQEMDDQKAEVLKKMEELRDAQIKLDDLCRNEELRVSACVCVSQNLLSSVDNCCTLASGLSILTQSLFYGKLNRPLSSTIISGI